MVGSKLLVAATVFGVFAMSGARASAADEAMFKYRESVMEAVGGHTTAIAAIVKNDVAFADDLKAHAVALNDLAKMTGHIFPKGSAVGESEALPAIWEKPEEFKKAVTAFQTAAADLAAAADDGPRAVAPALGALTKSCKSCHDDFRKKK